MTDDANVKVFCRVRPPNEREGALAPSSSSSRSALGAYVKKCVVVPASDPLQQTVFLTSRHQSSAGVAKTFTFDRAFSENATQTDVFDVVGVPITQACLEGYNGTIFAYGQTGSGKTFTMQGPDHVLDVDASRVSPQDLALRGLVPRVFDYLFQDSTQRRAVAAANVTHTFACSFLEIYNERVYDLLDGGSTKDATGLQLRENGRKGVFVEGLIESVVTNAAQAAQLMTLGAQNRRVGQTAMNRESSRSHSVFVLQIQSKETTAEGVTKVRSSRFNLVDLAGSERQRTTEAAGERLKEAGSINKSLSALGNVIMGLVEQSAGKNRHVHYRDSKLTFLLKDSLGGNSKTFMIATVSPAEDSAYETLSTLKFAQRAKLIRNNAVINEDATGSVVVLQEEIQRLRRQLQQAQHASATVESSHALAPPVAPTPLTAGASTVLLRPSDAPTASSSVVACDPVVDRRFRELEAAFATSVEKNSALKRAHERLKVQDEHVKALCSELKRQIAHLKLVLRLRQHRGGDQDVSDERDALVDYEPSADAIEWRLKYDELEESFAELQDEVQRRRMTEQLGAGVHDPSGSHADSGEIERLDLMMLALTKQLAHVVRDKHELQDRLAQATAASTAASDGDVEMDTVASLQQRVVDKDHALKQLQDDLSTQAHVLQGHVNAALAARDAADAKARDASLELLEMKQKDAAWSIQDKERAIRLVDAERRLRQAEDARQDAERRLTDATQEHMELLARAERAHATAQLDLEARLTALSAQHAALERAHEALGRDAAALGDVHSRLEQETADLSAAIAALRSELTTSEALASDRAHAIAALESSVLAAETKLQDARATIDRTEQRVQSLLDSVADLEAARAALESDVAAKTTACAELEALQRSTADALARSESNAAALAADTQRLDDRVRQLTTSLETTRLAHADLESRLAASAQDNAALRATEATLRESIAALEATARARDATVAATQQELAALAAAHATELTHVRDDAAAAREQLTTDHAQALERLTQDFGARHAALEATVADRDAAAAALQQSLDEHVATAAREKRDLERAHADAVAKYTAELAAAHARTEALTRELAQRQSALDDALATAQTLRLARDELQRELTARNEAIAALESAQTELTQSRDALRVDLTERTSAVASLETAQQELTRARDALAAELETQRASFQALVAENEALTQRLDAAAGREAALSSDVAAVREQHEATVRSHDRALAALEATHADALMAAKATADAAVAELAASRDAVAVKTEALAARELEREALVAQVDGLRAQLAKGETANASTVAALERALDVKATELERTSGAVRTQQAELKAYATSTAVLKSEVQSLKKLHATQTAELESARAALRARVTELEQELTAARADSGAAKDAAARSLEAERSARRERTATLEAALADATAALETTAGALAEAEAARDELAAAQAALTDKVAALESENRSLARERETQADLTALADRLDRQARELSAKRERVASDLRDVERERTTLEQTRADYSACKARVAELEPLVAELTTENKRLARETEQQQTELAAMAREHDKLVGHDNKRQKIQYHFRVKEENNRLLAQVRQLTDDRSKLERQLQKLKEKENVSDARGPSTLLSKRPSASGSSSSTTAGSAKARTLVGKKLVASSLGGLESASLASGPKTAAGAGAGASKKRQHSRIDR